MNTHHDYVYLDHAAATPVSQQVFAAMQPYFSDEFYNPSSPYAPAVAVRRQYEDAKSRIAHVLGATGDELVITAGATESINLAFTATIGHVVTTEIEHQAVREAAKLREHTFVPVDRHGRVELATVKKAIRPDTTLISVALANNEIGTVQPLREIAALVHDVRLERLALGDTTPLYLHSDASQGVGQLDTNVARLGVDMLTINAAKIYGPKQVGLLYAGRHVPLRPTVVGGGQERGLRSGTENVAGTIGFAVAMERAEKRRKSETERLQTLRDVFETRITEAHPDAVVSGHPKHRLASHLHVSFPGVDAERLVFMLENKGILVATGSACAANKGTRSHVLTAIGLEDTVADGSLRLTLGALTGQTEIDRASHEIIEAVRAEKKRIGSA